MAPIISTATAGKAATAAGKALGSRIGGIAAQRPQRKRARSERTERRAEDAAEAARTSLAKIKDLLAVWPHPDQLPCVFFGCEDTGLAELLDELDRHIQLIPHDGLRRRFA